MYVLIKENTYKIDRKIISKNAGENAIYAIITQKGG